PAVPGGPFPAEIWRLFMEPALEGTEPESFPEPTVWPEWKPFTRGKYALTYDPNYSATTDTETETPTGTAPAPAPWTSAVAGGRCGAPGRRPRGAAAGSLPAPSSPCRRSRARPWTALRCV